MTELRELSADEFDKLIEPAFAYLRQNGHRELALRLIALCVDYERATKPDEMMMRAATSPYTPQSQT